VTGAASRDGRESRESRESWNRSELSDRQAAVLRAVVTGYVADAAPVGSRTIAHLLLEPLSPASVRNTLAELTELGLVEKPHTSAGRVPTERGLRLFVDRLLDPDSLASYEKHAIAVDLEEAGADTVVRVASQLLSAHTRQLGFVVAPRLDRLVLRHLSLVRLSAERLLVVLVSQAGDAHRRVIAADPDLTQRDLDRIAPILSARVAGRTLWEVRDSLAHETRAIRREARRLLVRVAALGTRLGESDAGHLVIASRLALLDQPEFHDPRRVRELFEALETQERLLDVLDDLLEGRGASVVFGEETGEPGLRRCALVAARYGDSGAPLGTLGVIGPSRMDYRRVIPLVEYLSEVITRKLGA
jgi:heat-inducible transcriptional repressor